MKAITTKHLGATQTKPARIKAFTWDGCQKTIDCPDGLNEYGAHKTAAIALQVKMKWPGRLIGGGITGGYAFVFLP
jgi:hypothetical protein